MRRLAILFFFTIAGSIAQADQVMVFAADKPLSSSDIDRNAEIVPYFKRLKDQLNVPIVYVSHDADGVARLAPTLPLLDHGKIIAP